MDVLLAASEDQARQASLQAAQAIRDTARDLLSLQHHDRGTKTPSAPGEPPAMISGSLWASMTAEMMTADEAWVGPTSSASSYNGPYGRIQELGGLMEGRPWMRWFEDGKWHRAQEVFLPDREYLEPATRWEVDSGRVWEIYAEHQTEAILEATG